jgi:hypothetical protein
MPKGSASSLIVGAEPFEDGAAGRVGEGREHAVDGQASD